MLACQWHFPYPRECQLCMHLAGGDQRLAAAPQKEFLPRLFTRLAFPAWDGYASYCPVSAYLLHREEPTPRITLLRVMCSVFSTGTQCTIVCKTCTCWSLLWSNLLTIVLYCNKFESFCCFQLFYLILVTLY